MVDDVGTVINPLTLAGQIHGGVAQGVGQMLMEQVVYEPGSGQLLTASFMDYAMPRADIDVQHHDRQQSGADARPIRWAPRARARPACVGALPAVMIAVMNALGRFGVRELDMPATSERVWQAIQTRAPRPGTEPRQSRCELGPNTAQALRDGRRVWVLGEGLVDDVTTHPATRPMVDEYVAWYDRHFDPAWQDVVLTPPCRTASARRSATSCRAAPTILRRMGRCFSATTFLSAGNITHTPAYGHMIALGVLHAVGLRGASPEQVANAEAYRAQIASTGRFLTFAAGAATIGYRLREDPGRPGRAADRQGRPTRAW